MIPSEKAQLLLELLHFGRVRRRVRQPNAWQWLIELPWTLATNRRDERELISDSRKDVQEALEAQLPAWRELFACLSARQLEPTPDGLRRLADIEKQSEAVGLPAQLNRRTALAAVGPHSKAKLSRARRNAIGTTELTAETLLRIRPSAGLWVRRGDRSIDAAQVAAVTGELILTERAIPYLTLEGTARALLTVENLGAYVDLEPPEGWTVAWIPGWDSRLACWLLQALPHVPVFHFGDLDPNGMKIVTHLQKVRPDLRWFVPEFWAEHLPLRALACRWPDSLQNLAAPPLVRRLIQEQLWLEQESLVLDPRLQLSLRAELGHDR